MRKPYGMILAAAVLLYTLLWGGCAKAERQRDEARKEALAQEFMTDLRDNILIYREKPKTLAQQGLLVSNQTAVDDAEDLQAFCDDVQNGEAAQLTIAFYSSSPLVVTRIQFADKGEGYYFRYELDESAGIAVTAKYVDQVELSENSDTGKLTLTLKDGGAQIAQFSFKPS